MLTAKDVASILGLSRSKIYELAASSKLPSYRFDGALRFEAADVEAFKRGGRVAPAALRAVKPPPLHAGTLKVAAPPGETELDKYFRAQGLKPRPQRLGVSNRPAEAKALKQYPAGALLRVKDICGDRQHGQPGLLPIVSRTWLKWVEEGKVPKGILLGTRTRVWPVEQVLAVREAMWPARPGAAGPKPASA